MKSEDLKKKGLRICNLKSEEKKKKVLDFVRGGVYENNLIWATPGLPPPCEHVCYQPAANVIKSTEGTIICEKYGIIDRWADYFEGLLNTAATIGEEAREESPLGREVEIPPPTIEEVRQAMSSQKNCRTPRYDDISAEMLKKG